MIEPDKNGLRIGRRRFLGAGAALTVFAGMPRQLFAAVENEARFVFVILRGGLDGLAAVPPYGDGQYSLQRPAGACEIRSVAPNAGRHFWTA
jgi:uncharacterized protein (DUF1501 family)